MRKLILTYSITGDHLITVPNDSFTKEQIRLIINETLKKVLASSMLKDNIISVSNHIITLSDNTPALVNGNLLTIEISNSDVFDLMYEIIARDNIVGDLELIDYLNSLD